MRAVCVVLVVAGGVVRAVDEPRTIDAGKQPARVAFAPDGKAVAVGSGEALKLLDPATGKEVAAFAGTPGRSARSPIRRTASGSSAGPAGTGTASGAARPASETSRRAR